MREKLQIPEGTDFVPSSGRKGEKRGDDELSRAQEVREKFLEKVRDNLQIIQSRHDEVCKRLGVILGNSNIIKILVKALKDNEGGRQIFENNRQLLVSSVVQGKGEMKLKKPDEIVPWKVGADTGNDPYAVALSRVFSELVSNALRNPIGSDAQKAVELDKQRQLALDVKEAIRRLVGPQWKEVKDKREPGSEFWSAFEERLDDKAEIRKQFDEEARKIIDRGGFMVYPPSQTGGPKGKGVVLLEKIESKKSGNEVWRVAEVLGDVGKLKVGATSPLDMKSFPKWLKEQREKNDLLAA